MLKKTAVQKAFNEIFEERIHKVATKKAQMDEFFVKADNKRSILLELLCEALTTDKQRHLLDELESAWNFSEGLMYEYTYRQGLQDSRMIHKELSDFGIAVVEESVISGTESSEAS